MDEMMGSRMADVEGRRSHDGRTKKSGKRVHYRRVFRRDEMAV